MNRGI